MLSDKELKKKHLKIISKAIFHKTLMTKGQKSFYVRWDKLSVETYKYANPFLQTYFAGYLEGRMTANDIYNFYNNIRVNNKPNAIDFENMRKFFKSVNIYISKKLSEFPNMKKNDKEFWSKLILGYSQLKGLKNGYNFEILRNGGKNKTLEIEDFLIIQSDGEIPELLSYYKLKKDISVIQEKRLNLMTRTSLNQVIHNTSKTYISSKKGFQN